MSIDIYIKGGLVYSIYSVYKCYIDLYRAIIELYRKVIFSYNMLKFNKALDELEQLYAFLKSNGNASDDKTC